MTPPLERGRGVTTPGDSGDGGGGTLGWGDTTHGGGGGRGGGMWVLCVGLARGSWGAAARIADGLLQFRRDVLKAVPVALIAIPPFANFLVLLLM